MPTTGSTEGLTDAWPLDPSMVTTTEGLIGHRTVRAMGIVQGVGRHGRDGARAEASAGVDPPWVEGYEDAFATALRGMMARAVVLGANAVVGVRCEVAPHGLPAVVAYGTAVRVEVVA